jgi:hypothetical protein
MLDAPDIIVVECLVLGMNARSDLFLYAKCLDVLDLVNTVLFCN